MTAFASWAIEFTSGIPVYKQIVNLLFYEIGNGNLREGDRLPTIKELADRLGVNPNTVAKAYRELDVKGVITGRRGDGSFVAALTGSPGQLTRQQKQVKLDELLGRLVAEAKGCGITQPEMMRYFMERMGEDESL